MRSIPRILTALAVLLGAALSAPAAHTQARLILSARAAKPGQTILAGVDLKMDPDWHTYWKNPGDAGMPTQIQWQLPPGVSAGAIQWPVPQKIPPPEVTTYGYEHEVVLMVPLTLAANLKPGPLNLKASVSWLECKQECVPAGAPVQAVLTVADRSAPSTDAALLEAWRRKLPQSNDVFSVQAWWEKPLNADTRPLVIRGIPIPGRPAPAGQVDFFPEGSEQFAVAGPTQQLSEKTGFGLRKTVQKFSGGWPAKISGLIRVQAGDQPRGFSVTLAVAERPAADQPLAAASGPAPLQPPLWRMLVYAFIGGLILNIMPCVLPVIALKILGFVGEAGNEPRRVRRLGLLYTLGVLVSFLVLAGIVIGVKAAGHRAGWGMQFSNPEFLVALTALVLLVALNLFGVFEVNLGGRALDAAGHLASRRGAAGAFFNGVLATALATPCTAPFLGAALGFAFAQQAGTIVLVFTVVGIGLALPYLVLSWQPAWLKFLPRPGAWMEKFKVALGFPMLATAVWLFNLSFDFYGKRALWLGIFLVFIALAAWIFGEFVQRGARRRGLAFALMLALLAGGYAFAMENQLDWRHPPEPTAGGPVQTRGGIPWQRWSPEAVARARAAGHPVLVDFTADWCLTCQVNKKTSLEIPSVGSKLRQIGAVALLGDYTRTPENITRELNRFGRAGVPLVLVYPKNPDAPPAVLPEVLTPGIVLTALDRAAQ